MVTSRPKPDSVEPKLFIFCCMIRLEVLFVVLLLILLLLLLLLQQEVGVDLSCDKDLDLE